MQLMSNLKPSETKVLHDSGHLQVVDINGYVAIQEPDMVVCIPYLIEQKKIMLRYENIPTFELSNPAIEKYINVMSTTMNSDEEPTETLIRGLKQEFGIELRNIEPQLLNPIFINKGTTAKYHICILPIMEHNYTLVESGEVEKNQMINSNILVGLHDLKNIVIYDLITKYTLDIFKNEYALVF